MSRTLIAFLLAGTLALPVLAQQSSNSSQQQTPSASDATAQPQSNPPAATDQSQQSAQPSTQPAQASDNNAAANANTSANGNSSNIDHQPLTYQRHEGFWGKLNPFARKKYVQRQMDPVRDRVNELDELTAANSKNIKDVDPRASEGIRQASSRADQADQHAIDAGNRPQAAQQTIQHASTDLDPD